MNKVLDSDTHARSNSLLFEFTEGLEVDKRLYAQEIKVQLAWADALQKSGYLSPKEFASLKVALGSAKSEIESGHFIWSLQDEDIHMNLERYLTEKTGDLGKKIHLGRSRNDLIASTLRLYIRDCAGLMSQKIRILVRSVLRKSTEWGDTLLPGLTHTQSGKVCSLGHMFLAHGWAFERDIQRFHKVEEACMEYLPLGAGPFSGTQLNLNLEELAKELGFESPLFHAYDAVGDRDFMIEALQAFSLLSVHLSRLCEEVIFWSSGPVGVMTLPVDWSTGSSAMPNKRNPDICELIRARCARVISYADSGCHLLKAVLPSYGSDLHELKKTFFLALDDVSACLDILPQLVNGLGVRISRATELLNEGHILATDIANHLCEKGTSFRDAYRLISAFVAEAEKAGKQVHQLESVKNLLQDTPDFFSAREKSNNLGGCSAKQLRLSRQRLEHKLSW